VTAPTPDSGRQRAEAASDEALTFALTGLTGLGPATASPPALMSDLDQAVRTRWAEWMVSPQARFCPHFPGGGGPSATVMYWYAAPGIPMACIACLPQVIAMLQGTAEDLTCDICRSQMTPNGDWSNRTLIVTAWAADDGQLWPAVNIHYAVCGTCAAGETLPDKDKAAAQMPGTLAWLDRAYRRQPRATTRAQERRRWHS
jgi:hypothetical protein